MNRIQKIFHLIRPKADSSYQANRTISELCRGALLCVVGVGRLERGEKKAPERRWKEEERNSETEAPAPSLFPSSTARLLFFDYCYFYWNIQWACLYGGDRDTIDSNRQNRYPVSSVGNFSLNSWRHLSRHRMVGGQWQMNSWLLSEDYIHVYEVRSWDGC